MMTRTRPFRIPTHSMVPQIRTFCGLLLLCVAALSACAADSQKRVGITDVSATDTSLRINCSVPNKQLELTELRPYEQYDKTRGHAVAWQGQGRSEIVIDRYDGRRDRIYSKFQLVDALAKAPIGTARYVTDISSTKSESAVLPRPKSIKGLSCIVDMDDAVELGVKYVHENVMLSHIVAPGRAEPEATWEFQGERIPLNMDGIRGLDGRMRRFTEAGIGVFVVFLNEMPARKDPGNPLLHPDSDPARTPTHLGAFNVTSDEGLKYYLAALEFMADRYTRPDAKYGLISNLIVGNEVQQHWVWYNMGETPEEKVLQDYCIALRMAWLSARKYHPDLRVYVSMDHHWAKRGFSNNPLREIPGKVLLEQIALRSKAEGDFPWNVAFHPYPENLFEPRFWRDRSPTDDFSTPRITFKNVEVLPRFMKQEALRYKGRLRDIALTEQGFHTPDGPDGEDIQAAAYAYAYYEISRMPEISAFILHRHVDHRQEGGLRLGLWTANPKSVFASSPLKKKRIWDVFRYADTPQWERHFEFAKPIVGLKEWSQSPVNMALSAKSAFAVDDASVVYDFVAQFDSAQNAHNFQCEPKEVLWAAGWMVPAILQRPRADGSGRLTYRVKLPSVQQGESLSLLSIIKLERASGDGVTCSVDVNGRQIWTSPCTPKAPTNCAVDMTRWAGQEIGVSLLVKRTADVEHDWAYWIRPIVARQRQKR